MNKFKLVQLNNPYELENLGIKVFKNIDFEDLRGTLKVKFEGYIDKEEKFISYKSSSSLPNVARGLHYQSPPYHQKKIINVSQGSILDVIYNVKEGKQTMYMVELKSSDNLSVEIPGGFAHGFLSLDMVKFNYICFGEYSEIHETTYNVFPSIANLLNIKNPLMSVKDSSFPEINLDLL